MKRVLITGTGSYIGTNFAAYAAKHYGSQITTNTMDMVDGSWKYQDFTGYDSVFHVAGLAHADVEHVTSEKKRKYYAVNTDLAVETASKAKSEGVTQFIFMSSAIIYGNSTPYEVNKRITASTRPHPSNFYGDSKWLADQALQQLNHDEFLVAILRPPMVYGKGCKGNYPTLAKFAKRLPLFPDINNERSMIYIDNLMEFICQVVIREERGILFPQNAEYSKTSDLVKWIAEANGKRIIVSSKLNWIVNLCRLIPGKTRELANKAFGNLSYDQELSQYDFSYQLVGLRESIERIEKA